MNELEASKAIKEVVSWVKSGKQDPLNGIEEIEFILEQVKNCSIPDVSTRTYSQNEVNNLLEEIASKFDNRKLYGTSVGGREWYASEVRKFKKS